MKPDVYVWKARRCPVLVTAMPPALAALAWFPDADWKLLLPALTFFGLFMLMAQVGRDRGSRLQDGLYESWGGKPTTVMLRHRDSPFDPTTLARLHGFLAAATGVPAPSRRKESASPDDADAVYDAYVRHLKDVTRDKEKYPLVFDENVSYGFRRNLLGLRPYGVAFALAGMLAAGYVVARHPPEHPPPVATAAAVVNAVLLLLWLFWVRRDWVRIPAQAYAERLFEAALRLAPPAGVEAPAGREPEPSKL